MDKPRIGITMGDPCGIGPEIIVKALMDDQITAQCLPVIFGDSKVIDEAQRLVGSGDEFNVINLSNFDLDFINKKKPTIEAGESSLNYIFNAIDTVMKGEIDAVVTAPISKESTHLAGSKYPGHTELLQDRSGAKKVAMMFEGGPFRVVLVTIHVPLASVSKLITKQTVLETIEIAHRGIQNYCSIDNPKLVVAGLNPHAGESGAFGDEEALYITPAVKEARDIGIDVEGPLPADTLFYYAGKGKWDCVIAMYHDQGLIPFKMLSFDEGVNVTLGLPFVRTSPDHGTAFDIAWTGKANPSSMKAAIKTAVRFIKSAKSTI